MKKKNKMNLQSSGLANLQTTKTLTRHSVTPSPKGRGERTAFTLAEVLITLAIIGIVATMTIPTLITQNQQKSWDKASSIFNRKLGEALKVMNSQQTLSGHQTTRDFLDELSKHIKITKICDSDKLTNCFVDEIFTGEETIKTANLKKALNLNKYSDYDTETLGVQFSDGVSALIAYNPNATQDAYNNQIIRFRLEQKSNGDEYSAEYNSRMNSYVVLSTDALSILYDVSSNKSPNYFDYSKDIRGINVSILGSVECTQTGNGPCVLEVGTHEWQVANNICQSLDLKLPSIDEMNTFIKEDKLDGFPSTSIWTSSESNEPGRSRIMCSLNGNYYIASNTIFLGCGYNAAPSMHYQVVCIEK